ncbi:MAG: hypothetical protein ACKVY0_15115 [Prosthecobacter sp.]|uniref:hypothetical protein n=1 Tax=Prosthecobacter sp. TaxID=1965333 RepID=UPI0038FEC8E4
MDTQPQTPISAVAQALHQAKKVVQGFYLVGSPLVLCTGTLGGLYYQEREAHRTDAEQLQQLTAAAAASAQQLNRQLAELNQLLTGNADSHPDLAAALAAGKVLLKPQDGSSAASFQALVADLAQVRTTLATQRPLLAWTASFATTLADANVDTLRTAVSAGEPENLLANAAGGTDAPPTLAGLNTAWQTLLSAWRKDIAAGVVAQQQRMLLFKQREAQELLVGAWMPLAAGVKVAGSGKIADAALWQAITQQMAQQIAEFAPPKDTPGSRLKLLVWWTGQTGNLTSSFKEELTALAKIKPSAALTVSLLSVEDKPTLAQSLGNLLPLFEQPGYAYILTGKPLPPPPNSNNTPKP